MADKFVIILTIHDIPSIDVHSQINSLCEYFSPDFGHLNIQVLPNNDEE